MNRPAELARRRWLVGLGVAAPVVLLAGCGLGNGPRRDFHLLRDADSLAAVPPGPGIDKVLLVSASAMPGLYDSDRMVFSADGRSRSYFQFGNWSERPAQSLQVLAETRLQRSKRFRDVAASTSGVRGDLLLSLRLDELYLDDAPEPGQVKLIVTAELIDWRSRQMLARRSFAQAAQAPKRDAGGLAEAASQAVGVMLGELVAWAAASASA
jgi:ABC-type uncharacterized transport system auxiliary subunit